jgi:hypothetical protein
MAQERVEQRPSGVWTIHYNAQVLVDQREEFFSFVDQIQTPDPDLSFEAVYNRMRQRNMACFQAVESWKRAQEFFSPYIFDSQMFNFQDPIEGQSGQIMLKVRKEGLSAFTIIDVAPYLYRKSISFDQLPVVIDNDLGNTAQILSGIYSRLLGHDVSLYPVNPRPIG